MPAPRTIKTRMVYDSDSAHDLLHRSATETRKALNHPEVKFDPRDGSGKLKSGDELVDKDLEFGARPSNTRQMLTDTPAAFKLTDTRP